MIVYAAHQHCVEFDRGEARVASGSDPFKHIVEAIAPSKLPERVSVEGVEADVDSIESRVLQRCRSRCKSDAVRRQRDPGTMGRRLVAAMICSRPGRSSGSPPVNRTSVTPRRSTANRTNELTSSSESRCGKAASPGRRLTCSTCSASCSGPSTRPAGPLTPARSCPSCPLRHLFSIGARRRASAPLLGATIELGHYGDVTSGELWSVERHRELVLSDLHPMPVEPVELDASLASR